MTLDRIKAIAKRVGIEMPDMPPLMTWGKEWISRPNLHDLLNKLDSAVGADTEWVSSLECSCLWHIGKTCKNRRAVGARVRMLEEFLALSDVKRQFRM